ncbi:MULTISPECIES: hypothetical protein [Pseudanabaena]|uniref:Uncharacterized protein n=1 Tax=Pseudanabaena catenata USMAC16 TaxID=1855837 RepID=A0A9X4M913_9CYAN|nr:MULTISPECIES: hypothetical protein [Pseudanabaena]MDG3494988.1 hypothetical protein [Pseudanabaena catenata USMAC16]
MALIRSWFSLLREAIELIFLLLSWFSGICRAIAISLGKFAIA